MGVVAMLIECGSCRSRYRIKTSMLKGFKGAEVRCRKCGGMIVVLTPGSESGTPEPGGRTKRRTPPRRPFPAAGKADRAAGDEMAPPVPSTQGLEQGEGGAQAGMALLEEPASAEPVPDNVFQLGLFRGVPPKHPPSEPYDISGQIRMDPAVSPARKGLFGEPPRPPSPAPERRDPAGSISPEETIPWKNEGFALPSDEAPLPSPGKPGDLEENPFSPTTRFQGGNSFRVGPRPSHVAIVYLLLLLLGGCGYLLVRFLATIANGGT